MKGFVLAALALLALLGCRTPATSVLVTVDTDLPWGPAQTLRAVQVNVWRGAVLSGRPTEGLRYSRCLRSSTDVGAFPLPGSLTTVPAGGLTAPLTVEVVGFRAEDCAASSELLATRAVVTFRAGAQQQLDMYLAGRCLLEAASCTPDQSCGRRGCASIRRPDLPLVGADASVVPPLDASLDSSSDATTDTVPEAAVELLRLRAPLSTARVLSQRPTLRWFLATGTDGAQVALCRDRALLQGCVSFSATGTQGAPSMDLAPGTWFWRVRATRAGVPAGTSSSVWQFEVGRRSAPVDTSWDTVLDVNGDGFADLAVGAFNALGQAGRVHVYLGSATGLASTPSLSLTGPDGAGGAFGYAVASAGDVNGDGFADLVVGAMQALSGVGRAYLYLGSATGLASAPSLTLTGPDGGHGGFGISVASAGDVNGDGFADLLVGAQQGGSGAGRAYVYHGGLGGPAGTPSYSVDAPDPGGYFGSVVAGVGDLNGDGFADFAVGAHQTLSQTGRVHVYLGTELRFPTTPSLSLTGPDGPGGDFGLALAGAGDLDGDGYVELVVGAQGTTGTGTAFVYRGGPAGLSSTPAFSLAGMEPIERFGGAVASAGDLNGDGYGDLAVGAYQSNGGTGSLSLYFGGSTGIPTAPSLRLTGPDGTGEDFGNAVLGVGDLDGDGFEDLVVGAKLVSSATGRVHVYRSGMSGVPTTPSLSLTGPDGVDGGFGSAFASLLSPLYRGSTGVRSASGRPCASRSISRIAASTWCSRHARPTT